MRWLSISIFLAVGLVSTGLSLTSCESKTQSTNTETGRSIDKQAVKTVSESKKEPSLEQMVEYQKSVETKLNKLENQINKLKNEAKETGATIKPELEKEIELKREYAQKKLKELKAAGVEAWRDVKSEMDSVINDLEASYEKAASELGG
jgi:TolA-binding protein